MTTNNVLLQAKNVGPGSVFQVEEMPGVVWMPVEGETMWVSEGAGQAFVAKYPDNLKIIERARFHVSDEYETVWVEVLFPSEDVQE